MTRPDEDGLGVTKQNDGLQETNSDIMTHINQ